jgi:hypothetical protein
MMGAGSLLAGFADRKRVSTPAETSPEDTKIVSRRTLAVTFKVNVDYLIR